MPPILLVNGATTTVAKWSLHPALGRLTSPAARNDMGLIVASEMCWAADNGALSGLDPDAYLAMLDRIAAVPRRRLLFVTVPDAVEMTASGPRGDWNGTQWLWRAWLPALRRRNLPAAIVAQDGAIVEDVPWNDIAALFIGGSTAWKLSQSVAFLVSEARRRGIWTHVGRVNSFRRLDIVQRLEARSFDGGKFSMFPDTYIPRYLARLGQEDMLCDLFPLPATS